MATHRRPTPDLARVVGHAAAEVIAAVPLKPAAGVVRMDPTLVAPNRQRLARIDAVEVQRCDPPPLKWSALRYGFRAKEDHDAEEETQARGDCCEAAPGGCAGVAGAERCRSG